MPAIRDLKTIAEKYATVTPARSPQYEQGVRNPRKSWADSTKAAAANYTAGIQAAIQKGAFSKGVEFAGDETWQEGAISKGPGRFAEGVASAGPTYAQGFAPYAEAIAKTVLPPRGPKGSPQNINRVSAMVQVLRAVKGR